MATPTTAITVSDYMRKPEIMQRFQSMLGTGAEAYVQSVLIVVGSDEKLRECTPQSIYKTALRAASLGLSCDPALKQGWIVPYNKKLKTPDGDKWVKEAQFQPHYLGLYNLAMRTGKYWTINVSAVYEGQRVLENPLTGLHAVVEGNGFIGQPQSYNAAYVDVTTRRKKDMKVIGWIAYFKAKKGNEKSIWMSCDEIEDHAQRFVKDYDKNPNWNDPDKRPTMEMKTVLRKLLAWADLSGSESAKLADALVNEPDYETIDAPPLEDTPAEVGAGETTLTREQAIEQLGFTQDTHRYNDAPIITAVMRVLKFSRDETAATMHEAFKKGRIKETLTISDAEQFARSTLEHA